MIRHPSPPSLPKRDKNSIPETGVREDFSSQPDTVTHCAAFISIFPCSCFLTCRIYAIENKGRDDGVLVIKGRKMTFFLPAGSSEEELI